MKNLKFVFVVLLICLFSSKIQAQRDSTITIITTDSTTKTTTIITTETTTEIIKENVAKPKLRMVRLYYSLAIGASVNNYFGSIGGMSMTYLLSNNWGAKFNMKGYGQVAKDLPADYRDGFLFGTGKPKDYLMAYSLAITKEFITSSPSAKLGLEAGFSIIDYKKARFERQSSGGFFSAANYKIEKKSEISFGLHLRAKAEVMFNGGVGMELAVISNINKFQSYVGVEIAFNLGMLRRKTAQ